MSLVSLAPTQGFSSSLLQTMDGRIVCCGIISLCQSVAILDVVKCLTDISSAVATTRIYLL